MSSGKEVLASAQAIAHQIIADRRLIHSFPELAYQEVKTAALVAERLGSLEIDVKAGVGGTGVIGLLEGGQPGKTVLLRADEGERCQSREKVEDADASPERN